MSWRWSRVGALQLLLIVLLDVLCSTRADAAPATPASSWPRRRGFALVGPDILGVSKLNPFDYLMFTIIYPTSTCLADDDSVPGSCEIPEGADQWTIHGLWPNYADGTYPQFCDKRQFDPAQVEELLPRMKLKWPNLFPQSPAAQLWKHEWEKHGTCSKSDPLIDTELKYFNMSLFLLDHIKLGERLAAAGVVPRDEPYDREELQENVRVALGGRKLQMNCLKDKKTHEEMLADVRICVNKDLRAIDCPTDGRKVLRDPPTPENAQPLPVSHKCGAKVYYVTAEKLAERRKGTLYRVLDAALASPLLLLALLALLVLTAVALLLLRQKRRLAQRAKIVAGRVRTVVEQRKQQHAKPTTTRTVVASTKMLTKPVYEKLRSQSEQEESEEQETSTQGEQGKTGKEMCSPLEYSVYD